ncbi:hypothetical protein FHR81_003466 [Actinoalloteichus hoggarensis]|uniref:GOLPH3/VPS74 family protein n=1 Tax=Actinoalloteichus hoggarensis TaxID=1470176 RepID=UPI0012FDE704|nr:GPP34 family phosphoprotein [Actinoalloteichus hoggarensis]MBB5922414.1 hypothetical protein [Actinoalloteichus hoggarensis]
MDVPETLAPRLYLLACDLRRQRLVNRDYLGLVLRAAALDQLLTAGLLTDENGRPATVDSGVTPTDRLQGDLLAAVAEEKPRAWKWWVRRHGRAAVDGVGEQLADAGLIRESQGRTLVILPARRVEVLRPEIVEELRRRVTEVLREDVPVERVDRQDAAMVSLAAEGQLPTVLSGGERRRHRARLAELRAHVGPTALAVRKAVEERQVVVAGSGGGGGG